MFQTLTIARTDLVRMVGSVKTALMLTHVSVHQDIQAMSVLNVKYS